MARLVWGARSERYYETGVDRGVLYLSDSLGIAWSGLISVTEAPTGAEARPYYLDGIKYLNLASAEEFEAVITAFNSPAEFGPCEGVVSVHNGLYATQQPRQPFSLSYRSLVGNDVERSEFAYKIHIVYNCLSSSSQRPNNTISDASSPIQFNWNVTTLPPEVTGLKRTAHFVIDSRTADSEVLSDLEDLLYGTTGDAAVLPTPDELIALFA